MGKLLKHPGILNSKKYLYNLFGTVAIAYLMLGCAPTPIPTLEAAPITTPTPHRSQIIATIPSFGDKLDSNPIENLKITMDNGKINVDHPSKPCGNPNVEGGRKKICDQIKLIGFYFGDSISNNEVEELANTVVITDQSTISSTCGKASACYIPDYDLTLIRMDFNIYQLGHELGHREAPSDNYLDPESGACFNGRNFDYKIIYPDLNSYTKYSETDFPDELFPVSIVEMIILNREYNYLEVPTNTKFSRPGIASPAYIQTSHPELFKLYKQMELRYKTMMNKNDVEAFDPIKKMEMKDTIEILLEFTDGLPNLLQLSDEFERALVDSSVYSYEYNPPKASLISALEACK